MEAQWSIITGVRLCRDTVVVEYFFDYEPDRLVLSITDIMGKQVAQFKLAGKKNQAIVPLHGLKPGLYIVSITSDNKLLKSEKMTIVR
jgi:hypothetical protein